MSSAEFEAISPGLPAHQDEVMAAHQCTTVDNVPASGEGRGMSDEAKYGDGS